MSNDEYLLKNSTYDRLVAWGRRWIPLLTVIFSVLSLIFIEMSKVPGLEAAAPLMITISGILAVFNTGLNEYLKRAKSLYTMVNDVEQQISEAEHKEGFEDPEF